ncbi:hypothetical protein GCM10009796_22970 [Microbacterium koreense]
MSIPAMADAETAVAAKRPAVSMSNSSLPRGDADAEARSHDHIGTTGAVRASSGVWGSSSLAQIATRGAHSEGAPLQGTNGYRHGARFATRGGGADLRRPLRPHHPQKFRI